MIKKSFFKPTSLYKEFIILNSIKNNSKITQRTLSKFINVSVSIVNDYINTYVDNKLVNKKKYNSKTVEYFCTKKGIERIKLLNIWYLKSSHNIYSAARSNILNFLSNCSKRGFKNIILYGAGEVAEIILHVISFESKISTNVLAIIDDDKNKQNKFILNKIIISLKEIKNYNHDGVFVTSYNHRRTINSKLSEINYNKDKVINFFD